MRTPVKPQQPLLVVVTAALVAVIGLRRRQQVGRARGGPGGARAAAAAAPADGTLALESKPQARVYIDDAPRGMTPLRLDLPAGPHRVRLEADSKARTLTVGVVAGAEVTQSVDLDRAVQTGSLFVRSDPAGAKVLVDNKPAGVTPITVLDLSPGSHTVSASTGADGANAKQAVQVEAGATATLRLTPRPRRRSPRPTAAAAEPTNGWVLVDAPDRAAGAAGWPVDRHRRAAACRSPRAPTTSSSALPTSRTAKRVEVSAGRVARIEVNMPDGTVNLNATPWAEVYLDGRSLGETPIANASVKRRHARSDLPQPAVQRAAPDGDRRQRQGRRRLAVTLDEEVAIDRRSRTAS